MDLNLLRYCYALQKFGTITTYLSTPTNQDFTELTLKCSGFLMQLKCVAIFYRKIIYMLSNVEQRSQP